MSGKEADLVQGGGEGGGEDNQEPLTAILISEVLGYGAS